MIIMPPGGVACLGLIAFPSLASSPSPCSLFFTFAHSFVPFFFFFLELLATQARYKATQARHKVENNLRLLQFCINTLTV